MTEKLPYLSGWAPPPRLPRLPSFFQAGIENKAHKDDPQGPEAQDDRPHREEKGFGEIVDNGIPCRIENPIVIVKKKLMEKDKGPVKIHGHEKAEDRRDGHGNPAGIEEKGGLSPFSKASPAQKNGEGQGDGPRPEDGLENSLDFFEVDPPFPGHGKALKIQRPSPGTQVIGDEGPVVFLDDFLPEAGGVDPVFGKEGVKPGLGEDEKKAQGKDPPGQKQTSK